MQKQTTSTGGVERHSNKRWRQWSNSFVVGSFSLVTGTYWARCFFRCRVFLVSPRLRDDIIITLDTNYGWRTCVPTVICWVPWTVILGQNSWGRSVWQKGTCAFLLVKTVWRMRMVIVKHGKRDSMQEREEIQQRQKERIKCSWKCPS
jgi:hypothetical protein